MGSKEWVVQWLLVNREASFNDILFCFLLHKFEDLW